ncbi:MAG: helix-turn-helix transcriptional regulator [Slackia sp.]|nr:helix-turn-helix transcriptional regulator [Slackia sp.]
MELFQFYSMLVVQLVSVLAGAGCLSVYLVSRRRGFLYAFWAFLFYFLDATLIFQDAFVATMMDVSDEGIYLVARSVASVVSGGGVFVSLWLLACDFVGEKRKALLYAPAVLFVTASLAALLLDQAQPANRFVFYSMRALLFFWTLGFLGVRYFATTDAAERQRMRRFRVFYVILWLAGLAFFAEDAYFFLIDPANGGALSLFSAERNYSEEALMLICAAAACTSAYRALSLRYEQPPVREDERVESLIDGNLALYGSRHKLSKREQEVLRLILLGTDNQNIASTMGVAPSTAKVHVHNILRKTGHANRQDLIQDFWSTW